MVVVAAVVVWCWCCRVLCVCVCVCVCAALSLLVLVFSVSDVSGGWCVWMLILLGGDSGSSFLGMDIRP